MKRIVTRTERLLDAMEEYLRESLGKAREKWNAEDEDLGLPEVAMCHHGYCDPVGGLSLYPALILIVGGRDSSKPFFVDYDITVGLAIKSEDTGALVRWGQAYEDILEDVLDSDHSLGGSVLDINGQRMDKDIVSGTYLITVTCKVTVDRGGYVYAENEYGTAEGDAAVAVSEMRQDGSAANGTVREDELSGLR